MQGLWRVGVMQRPGRIHITWENPNTLKLEADAGTQTRLLHFGAVPADKGQPSWQGYSVAEWQLPGSRCSHGGRARAAGRQHRTAQASVRLKV